MAGGNGPAADHWWYPVEADEAGGIVHVFGGTDEPLELVWNDGGGAATGQADLELVSCSILPSSPAIPEHDLPPSEDVMASWLYPIVSGRHRAPDDGPEALTMTKEPAMVMGTMMTAESSNGKLPTTDVIFGAKDTNSGEKENTSGGHTSRKRSATHSIIEKRRRCRIAEKLRTLKQLVPGCDHKSSHASTLDQTIRYMRSLQQQVQSMSTSWQAPAASAAVAMSMPGVVPLEFVAMLPYPHYHALMMPPAAPAAPLYPPPPAPAGASATGPDATGRHAYCSVSTDQLHQRQHKD